MRIIEIVALSNGAHRNQTWNAPVPPEGYAVIPDDLETPNFPFGDIEVEEIDGIMTVTAWTPGVLPEPEPEPILASEPGNNPSAWDEMAVAITEGVNDV